jgi:ORF6N domain
VALLGVAHAGQRILLLRGQKALVDADLAELYGVTTKRLNQQTRRNAERFPADFVFELTPQEKAEVVANCNHLAKLRFSPALPLAFTEHGALMAAAVLNTPRAVEMSLYVVRAFVRLREILATHKALAGKLEELERAVATLDAKTDARFRETFNAIRALMTQPEPKRRPIGFVTPEDRKQRG